MVPVPVLYLICWTWKKRFGYSIVFCWWLVWFNFSKGGQNLAPKLWGKICGISKLGIKKFFCMTCLIQKISFLGSPKDLREAPNFKELVSFWWLVWLNSDLVWWDSPSLFICYTTIGSNNKAKWQDRDVSWAHNWTSNAKGAGCTVWWEIPLQAFTRSRRKERFLLDNAALQLLFQIVVMEKSDVSKNPARHGREPALANGYIGETTHRVKCT